MEKKDLNKIKRTRLLDDEIRKFMGLTREWVKYLKQCKDMEPKKHKREMLQRDIDQYEVGLKVLTNMLRAKRGRASEEVKLTYARGSCSECGGSIASTGTRGENACCKCGLVISKSS